MAPVNRIGFTQLGASSARDGPCRFKWGSTALMFLINGCSIIFVHGLRGHPKYTWVGNPLDNQSETDIETIPISTSRGFLTRLGRVRRSGGFKNTEGSSSPEGPFWAKDFLAEDILEAKVWTYGYNADTIEGIFQAGNQNTVFRYGEDLAVRFNRDIDNAVRSVSYSCRNNAELVLTFTGPSGVYSAQPW